MRRYLLLLLILLVLGVSCLGWAWWSVHQPLVWKGDAKAFILPSGSSARQAAKIMLAEGVPLPFKGQGLVWYARLRGVSARLKAGSYDIERGMSTHAILVKLIRGEFAEASLTVVEGWNLSQLKQAIAQNAALDDDIAGLSNQQLLQRVGVKASHPEGLFFPDTYRFAKGSKASMVLRQAYQLQREKLAQAWQERAADLPLISPYQALILASIVEKETGHAEDRARIAAVFINRLRHGMLLQTDPTVIYGLGEQFDGNLRKRDLTTDTPYNTYTRAGLPPTPIALPGSAALYATLHPAPTNDLYFVARGDGRSEFSLSLTQHNNAVNKYQRKVSIGSASMSHRQ